MGILTHLWQRMSGATAPSCHTEDPSNRRNERRFADGSTISLVEQPGAAGNHPARAPHSLVALSEATLVDVSASGARFRSRQALPVSRRVQCRVSFSNSQCDLGMKIVWARATSDGYEYGARYVPVVPGTQHLLENYTQRVLLRAQEGA